PLGSGWHVLVARRPGVARGRSPALKLQSRGRTDGIDVRLVEPDAGEGDLVVQVVRDGGEAVAGAEVRVRAAQGGLERAAKTNVKGFASVHEVPAGDVEVEAVLPDPKAGLVVAGRV